MKLLDIVTSPWAILPEALNEIRGIYETHMRGEKIDIKGVEDRLGRPLDNQYQPYDVTDGVATITIDGPIARRMNLMSRISGGASSELVGRDFKSALNDPRVRAIVLDINSPGGTVDGTQELAQIVESARGVKPVAALARGVMASAAYWIGAAADKVYLASGTTAVGSIGVVATHVDISGAEKRAGIKTTEITAGRYKRIASGYEPLTPEGRSSIQDQVDAVYSVFVDDIARLRGVHPDTVLARMADGRVFMGEQAIAAGLADGFASIETLISSLGAGVTPNYFNAAGDVATITTEEEVIDMTAKELQEKYPEAVAEIRAEILGSMDVEGDIAAATAAGAAAERERIQSVRAQSLPGHEALIETLSMDGKTTGPEAAVAVLNAEKAKLSAHKAAFSEGAPAVPDAEPPMSSSASVMKRADFDGLDHIEKRQVLRTGVKIID